MKCPVDNATLAMSERNGVEIDYCPECRGVWLDRSELDKIIERSIASAPTESPRRERPHETGRPRYDDRYGAPYQRKRESWLSELFD